MRIVSVQRVEPDPQPGTVCRPYQLIETNLVGGCPGARLALTAELDNAPRVVPPAMVVRAEPRYEVGQFSSVSHARFRRSARLAQLWLRCASESPVSTSTGPTSSGWTSDILATLGAVVSHARYSRSNAQTAARCSGSSVLKSRLSVRIGQVSRRCSASARSTIGLTRSKK